MSAGLLSIMHGWFTDDLNKGYLENIFFVFGILVVVNMIWFIKVSKNFIYRDDRDYNSRLVLSDGDDEAGVNPEPTEKDGLLNE